MKKITPIPLETLVFTPAFFVEVILHKDFGKFYFQEQNKKKLLLIFLAPVAEYFYPLLAPFSKSIFWFLVIAAIRAIFELTRIETNRRKKKKIHSYSSGIPLNIWNLITSNKNIVRIYLEPLLIGLIAIIFIHFEYDILFGYFLAICAFSLFSKEKFFVSRAGIIQQSLEDSKIKQESIKKGENLPDYDNEQEQTTNIQEGLKSILEEVKNWRFKG